MHTHIVVDKVHNLAPQSCHMHQMRRNMRLFGSVAHSHIIKNKRRNFFMICIKFSQKNTLKLTVKYLKSLLPLHCQPRRYLLATRCNLPLAAFVISPPPARFIALTSLLSILFEFGIFCYFQFKLIMKNDCKVLRCQEAFSCNYAL